MKGKIGKKILATLMGAVLSVTLAFTNFGGWMPGGEAIAATTITSSSQINGDGEYVLAGNIYSGTIIVGGYIGGTPDANNITLDLNGYEYSAGVGLYTGGSITIRSSVAGGTFGSIVVPNGTVLSIQSGTVEHVSVSTNGHVVLSGGTIETLSNSLGTVTQSGGTITTITSNTGTFNQTGGTNPSNYTVTFNSNGGENVPQAHPGYEGKLSSLPTPTRTGFTFDGWFNDSVSTTVPVTVNTVYTGDTVLVAHWTEASSGNGGNSGSGGNNSSQMSSATPNPDPVVEDNTPQPDLFDELWDSFDAAVALGGKQIVEWSEGESLPMGIMMYLQEHPELTLVFSYTYKDVDYKVVIPGKYVVIDPEATWYGPMNLYGTYGKYSLDETSKEAISSEATAETSKEVVSSELSAEGTMEAAVIQEAPATQEYVIKSGDTLNAIARNLGVTVRVICELNGIENPDRIRAGVTIKY